MTVAVIEVETTGPASRADRVVEVGAVLLDSRGGAVFREALSVAAVHA